MKTKFLIALIVACISAALFITHLQANSDEPTEDCDRGPRPGTSDFFQKIRESDEELRRNGFLRACERNLARYALDFRRINLSPASLDFTPVDIRNTPFADLTSQGSMIEDVNQVRSRLYRGFHSPEAGNVTLLEWDMSADGSSIGPPVGGQDEHIHGFPARLTVLEAPSRKAVSLLFWTEGRRYNELWVDSNVHRTAKKDWLLALAASLPPSVPACPNEIVPEPFQLDATGTPLLAPTPATMTEEEWNKRFPSPRPCK